MQMGLQVRCYVVLIKRWPLVEICYHLVVVFGFFLKTYLAFMNFMVVLYRKYESRNTEFEREDLRYTINIVFMSSEYFSSILCWLTLQSCFGIKI